jgi:hypothetical protein
MHLLYPRRLTNRGNLGQIALYELRNLDPGQARRAKEAISATVLHVPLQRIRLSRLAGEQAGALLRAVLLLVWISKVVDLEAQAVVQILLPHSP